MKDGSYNLFNNQYSYYDHSAKVGIICAVTSKCHLLHILYPHSHYYRSGSQNIKVGLIINQSFYQLFKKYTLLQTKVSTDQCQIVFLFSNSKLYLANMDDLFVSSGGLNQVSNKVLDHLDTKTMDFQKTSNRLVIRVLSEQGDYLNIYLEGSYDH